MPLCEAATARGGERNKIDFVVCIRTKNTACPLRPPVILTCWPEAMVKVVIGMAMGTACITPALEVGVTAEPGLLTSAVFIEEGEAVITLVAVVEPVPTVAATETAAASFPAHWTPVPELEMMVAKAAPPLVPGMMARVVPVYSGFSCGGLAMSMWSARTGSAATARREWAESVTRFLLAEDAPPAPAAVSDDLAAAGAGGSGPERLRGISISS